MIPPRRSRLIEQHASTRARSLARPRWTRDFIPDSEIPADVRPAAGIPRRLPAAAIGHKAPPTSRTLSAA
jgi:hypothetical protein